MTLLQQFKIKRINKKIYTLKKNRVHNQPADEDLHKEISLYRTLAVTYAKLKRNKKFPFAYLMEIECYRAASMLEDKESLYHLGKLLLDEANYRNNLLEQGIFDSLGNERETKACYEEALACLGKAASEGHVQAKRLHGLCHINGWGMDANRKQGFALVMDSIEMENSWDKVPQIFKEIGLNKPEFFTELADRRGSSLK